MKSKATVSPLSKFLRRICIWFSQDGSLNGVKQPTALVLLDHGQKVFEQRLPEEPSDGPHTFYSLFVADEKRYGLSNL